MMLDDVKPCTVCRLDKAATEYPLRHRRHPRTGYPVAYRLGVCWECQRAREAVWRAARARRGHACGCCCPF